MSALGERFEPLGIVICPRGEMVMLMSFGKWENGVSGKWGQRKMGSESIFHTIRPEGLRILTIKNDSDPI